MFYNSINQLHYKQDLNNQRIIRNLMSNPYSPDSSPTSRSNVRQVYKFNFSDFHLAHRIHAYIKEKLIKFDINSNGRFEQRQIRQALVEILAENQQELQYVVNNVFRYDTDFDGAVTYQQFIRFCLEQHFGELAIQRLHMRNAYQNAHQRILNKKQFIQTLQYGFGNMKCEVLDQQLQQLFFQIDLDRDGFISYQDYFTFLREYFTMRRIDPVNNDRQPIVNDDSYIKNISRIVKLVFPQIRSLIIQQDSRRQMKLNNVDIREFISNNFKYCTHNPSKTFVGTLPQFPSQKNEINYEQALKIVAEAVFNPNTDNKSYANTINLINSNRPLSNDQFVLKFYQNQLGCIKVKPARYMMDEIYKHLTKSKQYQGLSQKDYVNFLKDIAQIYQPDYRVLN